MTPSSGERRRSSRFGSVLLGSVIAAAFVGPGTVATAASAGAGFGTALLWAVLFSTLACLVLQESAARLASAGGRDLGQALRAQYGGRTAGLFVLPLVVGAVVLGCAAYEAGNILGGVAGARLGLDLPPGWLTVLTGIFAAALLWSGRPQQVARLLGLLVAVMGVAFLVTAWNLSPPPADLLAAALVPRLPDGSGMLVLGLIGTTVVPYNLFLGAGLARGREIGEMRFGLAIAVLLGGLISMGIVIAGTAVEGTFSFEALSGVLSGRLGGWAGGLFAIGLFAAGFSSAVTAPLAAAITARGLYARDGDDPRWSETAWRFRAVWSGVLIVGVGFGLAGLRPVPAILGAQALNGILLPLVAAFLLLAMNDRQVLGAAVNGVLANLAMATVVLVTLLLGATHALAATSTALGRARPGATVSLAVAATIGALAAWPLGAELRRRRRRS